MNLHFWRGNIVYRSKTKLSCRAESYFKLLSKSVYDVPKSEIRIKTNCHWPNHFDFKIDSKSPQTNDLKTSKASLLHALSRRYVGEKSANHSKSLSSIILKILGFITLQVYCTYQRCKSAKYSSCRLFGTTC